jgi:uncharacterized protein (DUF983 family)
MRALTSSPYDSLDPARSPASERPLYPRAGVARVLGRGIRRRCPRCAERGIFRDYFHLRQRCPRCDLRFEREEGGFLGAMTLNYLVATLVWLVVLTVVLVATVPDVPVGPLVLVSIAIMVVVPLVTFPLTKSVWAAIEFLVLRNDPDYRPPTPRDPRARELE